jgi:hypothetical protein
MFVKRITKTSVISVQDIDITIASFDIDDYICITDMAKAKGGESRAADIIKNWIRNRATLEFLGTWESMFNPDFKVVEFDHFKSQSGLPTFTLSAKRFLSKTNYLIHTDAVKKYVLPQSNYTKQTEWIAYADEADLLNVALFGCTAKEWRKANPELAKKQQHSRLCFRE